MPRGNPNWVAGAKRFTEGHHETQSVEREPIAEDETEERVHPHLPHDVFYMDREQLAERGMANAVYACVADLVHPPGHPRAGEFVFSGDRVIVSVTPPAVADRVAPDILTKKKLARRSFEFARTPDGNLVPSTEDQVFATYDRDEYLNKGKRSKRFHNEQAMKFTKGLIERNIADSRAKEGAFKNFDQSQADAAKEQSRAWMRGVAGQRFPQSMTVEEIERHEGPDKIKALERRYARGNRSERAGEYEKWEEQIAQAESKMKDKGKGRSVSYPGQPTK